MLGDGKWNSGDQGSFFKYQYGVLKLLEAINASIGALPGVDYETRTTMYQAKPGSPTAPGAGYVAGDIIIRYDIIDVATSTLTATVWFNQTTQTTLVGAGNPNPVDLTPVAAPSSVTVLNPFNLEATQLAVLAALGPLATAANQATLNALITTLNGLVSTAANQVTQTGILTTIDADTGSIDSKLNTLGQKTMAGSVPVVIASDQTSVPVTLPTGAQVITSANVVAAGAVAAGATAVSFRTSTLYTGTINGLTRLLSTQYVFEAAPGKTLPAIAYTVTAGSIDIDTIV